MLGSLDWSCALARDCVGPSHLRVSKEQKNRAAYFASAARLPSGGARHFASRRARHLLEARSFAPACFATRSTPAGPAHDSNDAAETSDYSECAFLDHMVRGCDKEHLPGDQTIPDEFLRRQGQEELFFPSLPETDFVLSALDQSPDVGAVPHHNQEGERRTQENVW